MIFVTLGTQDKPFPRLLKAIEKQIELGNIKDEVIAQVGSTRYESDKMKIVQYMDSKQFDENLDNAKIIITHAGVGTIVECLKRNKKVIAAARLKEYGEHVNNHQQQILENFSKKGYILKIDDFEGLGEVIEKVETFMPREFQDNNQKFINELKKQIDLLLHYST